MATKYQLGTDIVAELIRIQGLSPVVITQGDSFKLPRLIPAGAGGTLQISEALDVSIEKLAATLKADRPTLRKAVRGGEWRTWVRNEIGPVLAKIDPGRLPVDTGPEVIDALEAALATLVDGLARREHAFGTTFLAPPDIPSFVIGPVTVEPAQAWLTRKVAEGHISKVTGRRIRKTWSGGALRPRKPGYDPSRERDILGAIGGSPYVVSVALSGFAPSAGLDAAATAARLALLTVALLWPKPSEVLRGLNLRFDGGVRSQTALTFVPGKIILAGWKLRGLPSGPDIDPVTWAKLWSNATPLLEAAGEAIDHLLSPVPSASRADLMSALAQALLWFYAGCREENDAFAVVQFSACLDALSRGGKARGIRQLLVARLGVKEDDPIYAGGPSFKAVVGTIYDAGRSRTIHGVTDQLGHDWGATRGLAAQLAHFALCSCLHLAGSDPNITTADQLKI